MWNENQLKKSISDITLWIVQSTKCLQFVKQNYRLKYLVSNLSDCFHLNLYFVEQNMRNNNIALKEPYYYHKFLFLFEFMLPILGQWLKWPFSFPATLQILPFFDIYTLAMYMCIVIMKIEYWKIFTPILWHWSLLRTIYNILL